jgi:predicted dehydrogenase
MRFLPVHLAMRDIIARGELGAIAYLEGYYIHNLTERASLYDRWRFEDNATPLVYSGCHFVDLLRWLLSDEVVEVAGMANNIAFPRYPESDTNVILLRFRSGVIGNVVTAFGFGRPQDHSVRIYGSEKCIENNLLFSKDGSFTIFAHPRWERRSGSFFRGRWLRQRIITRLFEHLMKTRHLPADYSVASYPLRLYEHGLAVRESLRDFVDAIANQRPPLCSVLDAAKTVATCLAGVEAYRNSRKVSVEKFWLPEFGPPEPSPVTG